MMLSRSINDCIGRQDPRWFATGNAAARAAVRDSKPRGASILLPAMQPAAVRSRLRLTLATNQLMRPCRTTILNSQAAAKSP